MLIDSDRDDEALLRIEDEAIRNAEREEAETLIPVGDDLARLIEDLSDAPPVHQG